LPFQQSAEETEINEKLQKMKFVKKISLRLGSYGQTQFPLSRRTKVL